MSLMVHCHTAVFSSYVLLWGISSASAALIDLDSTLSAAEGILYGHTEYIKSIEKMTIKGRGQLVLKYSVAEGDPSQPLVSRNGALPIEDVVDVAFESDIGRMRLYCDYKAVKSVHIIDGLRVPLTGRRPLHFRSIVRPDGYWTVDERQLADIPQQVRDEKLAVIGERNTLGVAIGDSEYGRLINPAAWFGEHADQSFSDWLSKCIKGLRGLKESGQLGDDVPPVTIEKREAPGVNAAFAIRVVFGPRDNPISSSEYIVSGEPHYLPIEFTRFSFSHGSVVTKIRWEYSESSSVVVPKMISRDTIGPAGDELQSFSSVLDIHDIVSGITPLPDSSFELSRIGIVAGVKLTDVENGVVGRFDGSSIVDGGLIPIPDERFQGGESGDPDSRSSAFIVLFANVILLAVVTVFVLLRRKRPGA